jgi:hypothetical protein
MNDSNGMENRRLQQRQRAYWMPRPSGETMQSTKMGTESGEMSPREQSFKSLAGTWEHDGYWAWHEGLGDFLGSTIFALNRPEEGGRWLTVEEVLNTGADHRFFTKEAELQKGWNRPRIEWIRTDRGILGSICLTFRGSKREIAFVIR